MTRMLLAVLLTPVLLRAEPIVLQTEHARVEIVTEPVGRVAAFRVGELEVPFFRNAEMREGGIRTWILNPSEGPHTAAPGRQPLVSQAVDGLSVRLRSRPNTATGLALRTRIELHPTQPWLRVTHGIENLSDREQRLALWGIAALEPGGEWILPALDPSPAARPHRRDGEFSRLQSHREGEAAPFKHTLRHPDAWLAYRRPTGILLAWSPPQFEQPYPDNGANLALYDNGRTAPDGLAEIEHMGPLHTLAPGDSLQLIQLFALLPPDSSPAQLAAAAQALQKW